MNHPEQEAIRRFILERIVIDEDDHQILKDLIKIAASTQKILKLKSYEELTFHPGKNGVTPLGEIQIERLSLVHPPSSECTLHLKISGYFLIKYKSSAVPLPMLVEPFKAIYRGIVSQKKSRFSIHNETIFLPENLILQ